MTLRAYCRPSTRNNQRGRHRQLSALFDACRVGEVNALDGPVFRQLQTRARTYRASVGHNGTRGRREKARLRGLNRWRSDNIKQRYFGLSWLSPLRLSHLSSRRDLSMSTPISSLPLGTIIEVKTIDGSSAGVFTMESLRTIRITREVAIFVQDMEHKSGQNIEVVTKFIHSFIPSSHSYIIEELSICQHLHHPHLLPLIGFWATNNLTCLVSEYMRHGTIIEYLIANPSANRYHLLRQIADGLQYMHSQNVVHGDIKGSNVLIDAEGNVKICDFGLSTALLKISAEATTDYQRRNWSTVAFSAPEVLVDKATSVDDTGKVRVRSKTERTDVYSFGMLIYELMSGAPPWISLPVTALVILHHTREKPPRPTESFFTDDLWLLFERCTDYESEKRPKFAEIVKCLKAT